MLYTAVTACRAAERRHRAALAAALDAEGAAHVASQWDDDLGGRSTRDFIEEVVVAALADALDDAPLMASGNLSRGVPLL